MDVAGGLGAHIPCQPAPIWRHPEPHRAIPCHRSMGWLPHCFTSVDLISVCTKGQDGVVLDPWVHCHGLGALQPTLELSYLPNFDMCQLHNLLWEPTKALRSKGGKIKGRSVPLPCRPAPKLPPPPYLTSISTLPAATNLGEL